MAISFQRLMNFSLSNPADEFPFFGAVDSTPPHRTGRAEFPVLRAKFFGLSFLSVWQEQQTASNELHRTQDLPPAVRNAVTVTPTSPMSPTD
jgi:hypothetical protein